jgi:hypothetical protein
MILLYHIRLNRSFFEIHGPSRKWARYGAVCIRLVQWPQMLRFVTFFIIAVCLGESLLGQQTLWRNRLSHSPG